jgi:hypothetical protein
MTFANHLSKSLRELERFHDLHEVWLGPEHRFVAVTCFFIGA